mgnify:FL=1
MENELIKETIKELQKEEDEVYKDIEKFVDTYIPKEKHREFFEAINKWVEVNIEIEGYCNQ